MGAKDELLNRLEFLSAAKDLDVVIDKGIVTDVHNGVANLLRKGLAIVAFNILEDFIKKRSGESLEMLSNCGISFSNLTAAMQEAAIYDSLNALVFRAKIEKKDGGDWRALIQDETLKIHSTKGQPFQISPLSFAYAGSNVASREITDILAAFGIKSGWNMVKKVCDAIGGGLPDPSQTYKNAFDRRHSSAHAADFVYAYSWLAAIKDEILAIAASLDILLTARCRQVSGDLTSAVDAHDISVALNYKFLEKNGGFYRETSSIGGRSRKNWSALGDALNYWRPRLNGTHQFLVVLDERKRINDWYIA